VGEREGAVEGLGMNAAFWAGKRVLVTGITGFKGAWLGLWLSDLGAIVRGYALPPSTSPSLFDLAGLRRRVDWVEGDVRERSRVVQEVGAWRPEIVFHLAAQSLVRASYEQPAETFETNVMGTVNVLEAVRASDEVRAVVIVTSDKCYENREWDWPYRENDRLGGHDPYSSSKACAEIVTASYWRSLLKDASVGVATARAGNVIGGGDWARDRLVPDVVSALANGTSPRIRNPRSIRPWQHVLEPLSGYLLLAERLFSEHQTLSESWNFGPNPDAVQTVSAVADAICGAWGEGASWPRDEVPQPHEAGILTVDSSKARRRLAWRPRLDYTDAVGWTVEWYKAHAAGADMADQTRRQLQRFQELP
jgi:CDP-glucose 4,6-dehydratase